MSPYPKARRFVTAQQQLDAVFDRFLDIADPSLSSRGTKFELPEDDLVTDTVSSALTVGGGLRAKGPVPPGSGNHRKSLQKKAAHNQRGDDDLQREGGVEFEAQGATAVEGISAEQIQEAASVIAKVGDELDKEYSEKLSQIRPRVMPFLEANQGNNYEIFASVLSELIGEDRDVTTMCLVMQLSKDIIRTVSTGRDSVRGMFKQFLRDAFVTAVEEKGDVAKYTEKLKEK